MNICDGDEMNECEDKKKQEMATEAKVVRRYRKDTNTSAPPLFLEVRITDTHSALLRVDLGIFKVNVVQLQLVQGRKYLHPL